MKIYCFLALRDYLNQEGRFYVIRRDTHLDQNIDKPKEDRGKGVIAWILEGEATESLPFH